MTAPMPLTHRQQQCLRAIQDYTDANAGVPPTLAQIGSLIGMVSRSRIHSLVGLLVEKGWVEHYAGRVRGLRLLHRLPPTPPQAINELLAIIRIAWPSPADGSITITLPPTMVAAILAAAPQESRHVG